MGAGEVFHGEGILAITKGLLQSGVSYVGGYQGAPISHLLDVMVQAKPYMDELGVHVEACSNEASAAAMLGAVAVATRKVAQEFRLWDRFTPAGVASEGRNLQALAVEPLYGPPFDNVNPWLIVISI